MPSDHVAGALRAHLVRIYGDSVAHAVAPRLEDLLRRFARDHPQPAAPAQPFDEQDVMLIAYGDQVREPGRPPLQTLREFLDHHLAGVVSGLHLLPHYPYTSDDGFAVVDHTAVDPALGDWSHVSGLADDFDLMLDAVVNHTSASHRWFARWQCDDPRFADFFIQVDPETDLSTVTRPRTSPLLTRVPDDGRWVWTTFSPDQIDLNYANPDVLLAVTQILLEYVARGARLLRLDAVAFLWKEPGTSCIHLPQTHEVIRLWRTVLDAVAPGTLLVTETNVPHRENVSYFGDGGDEAHLVYQFALPPLTLAAFHAGDATALRDWAGQLETPSATTTFLNFLASHDGIGLRPVEGLLTEREVARLCDAVTAQGGQVSYRAGTGRPSPYELNTVYLDALGRPGADEPGHVPVDRFVAAHSILLALAGVPAFYFHSLFGSRNWVDGAEHTGRARVINRQRFARARLERELADPASLRRRVLGRLVERIGVRVREPAFHPGAPQLGVDSGPGHLALQRTRRDDTAAVVCVHDVSGRAGRFRAPLPDPVAGGSRLVDLCDGTEHRAEADGTVDVDVPAYGVRWLRTT